ncbi:hypothetical protein [Ramlibacter sp.]
MSEELKSLEAGEYTLVARLHKGAYRGALWHAGAIVEQVQGASLENVYRQLEALLYERQLAKATSRQGAQPSVEEAVKALTRVLAKASHGQRDMLRAHFQAPQQRITATQLADAAGYSSYSAANLQYGLLGAMLFAEMPEDLPRRSNGTPIMTCVIASGEDQRGVGEEQWVWKMRPHIHQGLRELGGW